MTERHTPDALLREAASLLYLIGSMGTRHLVLIGGMVPPLLVPEAAHLHIGSADVDLCLSVAITDGATREYNRSGQAMHTVTHVGLLARRAHQEETDSRLDQALAASGRGQLAYAPRHLPQSAEA